MKKSIIYSWHYPGMVYCEHWYNCTNKKQAKKEIREYLGVKKLPNNFAIWTHIIMWYIKEFKTKESMKRFIEKNKNKIQYTEVFINNGYAIEYRKLIKAY